MPVDDAKGKVSVVEILAAYKRFAEGYYVKNGKVTNEVTAITSAMRIVKQLYGKIDSGDFGPLKLQAVQQAMVTEGWSPMALTLSHNTDLTCVASCKFPMKHAASNACQHRSFVQSKRHWASAWRLIRQLQF